jgi:hypothetical protein
MCKNTALQIILLLLDHLKLLRKTIALRFGRCGPCQHCEKTRQTSDPMQPFVPLLIVDSDARETAGDLSLQLKQGPADELKTLQTLHQQHKAAKYD